MTMNSMDDYRVVDDIWRVNVDDYQNYHDSFEQQSDFIWKISWLKSTSIEQLLNQIKEIQRWRTRKTNKTAIDRWSNSDSLSLLLCSSHIGSIGNSHNIWFCLSKLDMLEKEN